MSRESVLSQSRDERRKGVTRDFGKAVGQSMRGGECQEKGQNNSKLEKGNFFEEKGCPRATLCFGLSGYFYN